MWQSCRDRPLNFRRFDISAIGLSGHCVHGIKCSLYTLIEGVGQKCVLLRLIESKELAVTKQLSGVVEGIVPVAVKRGGHRQ